MTFPFRYLYPSALFVFFFVVLMLLLALLIFLLMLFMLVLVLVFFLGRSNQQGSEDYRGNKDKIVCGLFTSGYIAAACICPEFGLAVSNPDVPGAAVQFQFAFAVSLFQRHRQKVEVARVKDPAKFPKTECNIPPQLYV